MSKRTDQIDKLRWIKKHLEMSLTHLRHLEMELEPTEDLARDQVIRAWQALSSTFSLIYDIEHTLGCAKATGAAKDETEAGV